MLKRDFGIAISGLDPLPQDEHGIDLRTVFSVLRHGVMGQPHWDVIENAFLGIFSFSQFVMWNDVRNRMDDLLKNKIVRSLIDGRLSWDAEPMELGESVPEGQVLLPIPADASQLYAIESAAQGKSFVLHGPPGTGKSQTITALITNALAQGKSVLFVAEKMAALSVVQRRLEEIGIGPFCLELHSNKSKKKNVLDQLEQAANIVQLQSPEEFQRDAEQAMNLREELNAYADALHKKQHSGYSLYEMVNEYERHAVAQNPVHFSEEFAAEISAQKADQQKICVERLIAAGKAVGHPSQHPLSAIRSTAYSQTLRAELPQMVEKYHLALRQLEQVGRSITVAWDQELPTSETAWKELLQIGQNLSMLEQLPCELVRGDEVLRTLQDLQSMAGHFLYADQIQNDLLATWDEGTFKIDVAALQTRWNAATAKWILPRMLEQNRIWKSVSQFAKTGDKRSVPELLAKLQKYREEKAAADSLRRTLTDCAERLIAQHSENWNSILQLSEQAAEGAKKLCTLPDGEKLRKRLAGQVPGLSHITELQNALTEVDTAGNALRQKFNIAQDTDGDWLVSQKQLCRNLTEHISELREWIAWRCACEEADKSDLGAIVHAYEAGLAHEKVLDAYLQAFHEVLINETVREEPVLNTFSGAIFDEKIEQFKRLDQRLTKLNRDVAYCRLAANVPNFSREATHSSEVGILQRAIRSGGRGVSIRRLFEQIPNLLLKLCPCMLMSPMSAAQYLDPQRPPFDLVVFDEASQLPTFKAIGALARGENAVIVGDPKQMPPTSFFTSNTVDEDHLESEDLESILDDCLALNMPQTHLLWHYRSRHESLIAFSNRQFYENALYTFPSVNDLVSSVSLVHVDGFFDRGRSRQNQAEAVKIVEELVRRCHDPRCKDQSVGVVTFNISQQNLIDDLLTDACAQDSVLEDWAYHSKEPIFIKNLENVQGDERDVILFSIGYGPDQSGVVTMNFGPLNRDGGWRRLNVAVSRARQEMVVFATLRPEQIDLSRSSAQGVSALRAFLEYAQNGTLPETVQTAKSRAESKTGIADMICAELSQHGYQTRKMVGHSEYRIDIGVIDSKHPDQYLLGILLDGPMYAAAKTTRDREIAQLFVLRSLGWKLHRIWTMDWWDDQKKEIDHLLQKLKEVQSETNGKKRKLPTEQNEAAVGKTILSPMENRIAGSIPLTENMQSVKCQPDCIYRAAVLPLRPMTAEEYLQPQATRYIKENILKVLEQEAPISEGLLLRRIMQSVNIARAGSRMQGRTYSVISSLNLVYTDTNGQRYFWSDVQNPESYSMFRVNGEGENKRDAKDLPKQETANAVYEVLRQEVGIPKEDLVRETAKLFGYTRLGNNVLSAMEAGIQYGLQKKKIIESNNGNFTLKDD
ncbi:MAG: DUF3320 domain-containing protein [Oscillibacter sp.]|nr:DUF3320 domain-containing protein [Oscillibacter sp.]